MEVKLPTSVKTNSWESEWKSFITTSLWSKELKRPTNFTDLEFRCSDGAIRCHTSYLKTMCPFIKYVLLATNNEEGKENVLIIPDYKISIVTSFLEMVYTGNTWIGSHKDFEKIKQFGFKLLGFFMGLNMNVNLDKKGPLIEFPKIEKKKSVIDVKKDLSNSSDVSTNNLKENFNVKLGKKRTSSGTSKYGKKEPIIVADKDLSNNRIESLNAKQENKIIVNETSKSVQKEPVIVVNKYLSNGTKNGSKSFYVKQEKNSTSSGTCKSAQKGPVIVVNKDLTTCTNLSSNSRKESFDVNLELKNTFSGTSKSAQKEPEIVVNKDVATDTNGSTNNNNESIYVKLVYEDLPASSNVFTSSTSEGFSCNQDQPFLETEYLLSALANLTESPIKRCKTMQSATSSFSDNTQTSVSENDESLEMLSKDGSEIQSSSCSESIMDSFTDVKMEVNSEQEQISKPNVQSGTKKRYQQRKSECQICFKKFNMETRFIRHSLDEHDETHPFVCTLCPKRYTSRRHLDGHHKVAHLEKLDHGCDTCGKRFGYKSQLKSHMEALRSCYI